MANTFAVIVSGRLVQTDFQQVDVNKFLITIPNVTAINHVVVFLTGMIPLPDGTSAAVYFSFPDPLSPPSWIYLGFISNQKPSAIFKINKLKQMSNGVQQNSFEYVQSIVSNVAQIGISIEPQVNVTQMIADPSISADNNSASKFEEFSTKMAENLFNYCSSFANSLNFFSQSQIHFNQQFVPLTAINEWYNRFLRNFKQNPNFWR